MKKAMYITVGLVLLLGMMSLYAAYAVFSIMLHLAFIRAGIALVFIFLGISLFLFCVGHRFYKYARKSL